jgi:hypothetical protein
MLCHDPMNSRFIGFVDTIGSHLKNIKTMSIIHPAQQKIHHTHKVSAWRIHEILHKGISIHADIHE